MTVCSISLACWPLHAIWGTVGNTMILFVVTQKWMSYKHLKWNANLTHIFISKAKCIIICFSPIFLPSSVRHAEHKIFSNFFFFFFPMTYAIYCVCFPRPVNLNIIQAFLSDYLGTVNNLVNWSWTVQWIPCPYIPKMRAASNHMWFLLNLITFPCGFYGIGMGY